MRKSASWVIAVGVAAVLLGLAGACGKGGSRPESALVSRGGPEPGLTAVLQELDALAPPTGGDAAVFQQLKDELARQLSARAAGKQTLRPPDGEGNSVQDLQLLAVGDGTFNLQWTYRNAGDYDQNGAVGISDITPLAVHFGSTGVDDPDTEEGLVDGNGDQKLDIADITPIAVNFGSICGGYLLQYAPWEDGPWEDSEVVSTLDGIEDPARYRFTVPLPPERSGYVRVMPTDEDIVKGEASNIVALPELTGRPCITGVSPTELRTGNSEAFSATVTGDAPLTYLWDFGGGATPDTSGENSPTVDFGAAGTYYASLTVSNASGVSTFPFVLTLTEELQLPVLHALKPGHGFAGQNTTFSPEVSGTQSMAFHWDFGDAASPSTADVRNPTVNLLGAGTFTVTCTATNELGSDELSVQFTVKPPPPQPTWGGEWYEFISGIAVDDTGNVYAAGSTSSFGAGGEDVLLLKYASDGSLIFSRTWGTAGEEAAADIALAPDGGVYVVGGAALNQFQNPDILLLKFNASGDAVYSQTWGTGDNESATGVAVGGDGSVYLSATKLYRLSQFSVDSCALVLKYSAGGGLQFAQSWYGGFMTSANDVAVDPAGNVFLTGGAGEDAVLLKYDSSGVLLLSRRSIWNEYAEGYCIASDSAGDLYVAGEAEAQVILMKYDSGGVELYRRSWGGGGWDRAFGITLDDTGALYVGGSTDGFGSGWVDALELKYDPISGTLLSAYAWGTTEVEVAACIAARPGGGAVLGGEAPNSAGNWECALAPSYSYPVDTRLPAGEEELGLTSLAPAVQGTVSSPSGVMYTGGGRSDALVVFD